MVVISFSFPFSYLFTTNKSKNMDTRSKQRQRAATSATLPVRFIVGGASQKTNNDLRAIRSESETIPTPSPGAVEPSRPPTSTPTGDEDGVIVAPVIDSVVVNQLGPALIVSDETIAQMPEMTPHLNVTSSYERLPNETDSCWENDTGWTTVPHRCACSPIEREMTIRRDPNIDEA